MALIRIAHAGDNQRLLQNAADTVARVKSRRAILEYQLDLAAKRLTFALRHRGEVVPTIDNRAGIRTFETTDQASSRRLARSGGTHDRDELPFADREGDAAQCMYRLVSHPEIAPDVVQPDDLFHGFISSFCHRPEGQA